MIERITLYIAALLFMAPAPALAEHHANAAGEEKPVTALITGMSVMTDDAQGSADFYTKYLGYKLVRDVQASAEATKAVYGVTDMESFRLILIVPAIWSKQDPNYPGISFVEIARDGDRPFPRDSRRLPRIGEPVLGLEVNNLAKIERDMRADKVPVVVPLALSATGKSRALTVLDPNGMRIQLYEYVKDQD